MSAWERHVDDHVLVVHDPDCRYCAHARRQAACRAVARDMDAIGHQEPDEEPTKPDKLAGLPLRELVGGEVDEADLPELPPLVAQVRP